MAKRKQKPSNRKDHIGKDARKPSAMGRWLHSVTLSNFIGRPIGKYSMPVNSLNFLTGFALLFTDGRTEYWAYDPSVLSKKQLKMLGITRWKAFEIVI